MSNRQVGLGKDKDTLLGPPPPPPGFMRADTACVTRPVRDNGAPKNGGSEGGKIEGSHENIRYEEDLGEIRPRLEGLDHAR